MLPNPAEIATLALYLVSIPVPLGKYDLVQTYLGFEIIQDGDDFWGDGVDGGCNTGAYE